MVEQPSPKNLSMQRQRNRSGSRTLAPTDARFCAASFPASLPVSLSASFVAIARRGSAAVGVRSRELTSCHDHHVVLPAVIAGGVVTIGASRRAADAGALAGPGEAVR